MYITFPLTGLLVSTQNYSRDYDDQSVSEDSFSESERPGTKGEDILPEPDL